MPSTFNWNFDISGLCLLLVFAIRFFILGPCALDEIFFPYSSNSEKAIGSCFNIKSKGKVTYNEVDDVCLAEYGKGSKRSPFSKRDQEYRLLEGMISYFEQRPLR